MILNSDDFGQVDDTPLNDEELRAIKVPATNKKELNIFEAENVKKAQIKIFTRKRKYLTSEILTLEFAFKLHKLMFGDVWGWAGIVRKTQKNIGLENWANISIELKKAFGDTAYQLENQKTFGLSLDMISIQLAHKLVWIHPFENGNGRWSRLYVDVFNISLGIPRFSWKLGSSTFKL
jgi:Fic-DOC domain mobile mystery protein B